MHTPLAEYNLVAEPASVKMGIVDKLIKKIIQLKNHSKFNRSTLIPKVMMLNHLSFLFSVKRFKYIMMVFLMTCAGFSVKSQIDSESFFSYYILSQSVIEDEYWPQFTKSLEQSLTAAQSDKMRVADAFASVDLQEISYDIISFKQLQEYAVKDESGLAHDELVSDNGKITVKFDLLRGGAISWISISGSERNLVNIADEGRYIQQSYYAGKSLDRKSEGQSGRWSPWPWNPIQVGDAFGNRAKILDYKQDNDSLYVKCIPTQWDMNNRLAESEMEQWTYLNDNVLRIRNRLTCHRTDTIYGDSISRDQELPAVYPISALRRLYAYQGNHPFTGGPVKQLEVKNLSSGFWGRYDDISEHWMAFTDDTNFGMAVYNPRCSRFLAGMSGAEGGESRDSATSYIAPVKKETLHKNSVYEYEYYIVIGSLEKIRNTIYSINNRTHK